MTSVEFLAWVRGPFFQVAVGVFVIGVLVRLIEIVALGRKADLAPPRADGTVAGIKAVFRRSVPDAGTFRRSPYTIVLGYVFHIGLFITVALFVPHIELIHHVLGFQWPGLPTPLVDAVAIVTVFAMLALLVNRLHDPLLRFLSSGEDYLVWAVTLLPIVTGYFAVHRMLLPYQGMLALHILSVEILLIVFPFTKLMHLFTTFLSRWYTGASYGRRGVQS